MKKKEQKFRLQLQKNYFLFVQFLYENEYDIICEDYGDNDLTTQIKGKGIIGCLWLNNLKDPGSNL